MRINNPTRVAMRARSLFLSASLCLILAVSAVAGEFTGQFETTLVPNQQELERVVLKPTTADRWKEVGPFGDGAHLTSALIWNPLTGDSSVYVLLVEEEDEDPVFFIDRNGDDKLTAAEKFALKEADNPYLWEATVNIEIKHDFFKSASIFIQYFKSVRVDKMGPEDRLIRQSNTAHARGTVDVNGKKVAVQYALVDKKKVNPRDGWLGMDTDGDGNIDMDSLSPESTKANNEVVVFRAGNVYLSTKKADVEKNQIVLRDHDAKEYKRLELHVDKEFPDFTFSDFDGKKRSFSEFRGKYVLLDVWGFWCPPCRKELPYIKEANKRFANRNLVIVGLNTDEDFTVDSMKKSLKDNGMTWTQARFDSVVDFLRTGLRVNRFPTTFLISPQGKILSMSRTERKEPDLRGSDLLDTLDEVLPE